MLGQAPRITDRTVKNGGIDLNRINVNRAGKAVTVQFDPAMLDQLMRGGFEGFKGVITAITPIQSPWPLLGVSLKSCLKS